MTDEETTPAEEPAPEPKPLKRVSALKYVGETSPDGEPIQYVLGIAATDLDEEEIGRLTDDEYRTAVESGIYSEGAAAKSTKKGGS